MIVQVKSFASIVAGGDVTPTAIGILVGVTIVVFVSVLAVVMIARRVSATEKARIAALAVNSSAIEGVATQPRPHADNIGGETDRLPVSAEADASGREPITSTHETAAEAVEAAPTSVCVSFQDCEQESNA